VRGWVLAVSSLSTLNREAQGSLQILSSTLQDGYDISLAHLRYAIEKGTHG